MGYPKILFLALFLVALPAHADPWLSGTLSWRERNSNSYDSPALAKADQKGIITILQTNAQSNENAIIVLTSNASARLPNGSYASYINTATFAVASNSGNRTLQAKGKCTVIFASLGRSIKCSAITAEGVYIFKSN